MKKYIYSAMIMTLAAISTEAQAQNKVFLNKGTDKIEMVELGEGDYIAFGRPEGVPMQRLAEIVNDATTKNSISYTILAKTQETACYQMTVSEYFLDAAMQQYFGTSLATASEEDMRNVFSTLMYARYGYANMGSQTYSLKNGEEDANGETQWILGGLNYYIVTCDLQYDAEKQQYVLGNDMSYKIVKTTAPATSKEKIDVEYAGLDKDGNPLFSVKPSNGIKTLHMILATTRSVDEAVNVYGYDFLMATQASSFTAAQWNELKDEDKVWDVSKEDDYSFLVLGIDENGDQVKEQLDNIHIKPIADDNCPNLDTESFSCEEGELKVEYKMSSKTNSEITKATILLIPENTWDNNLNDLVRENKYEKPSEGWPIAAEGEGYENVTDLIDEDGTYTYTKSIPLAQKDWYALVFAVTDKNGTTITRTSFNSHLENAESETISHTYPVKDNSQIVSTAAKLKASHSMKSIKLGKTNTITIK